MCRCLSVIPKEPMSRRRRATEESPKKWQTGTFYNLSGDSSHLFFRYAKKISVRNDSKESKLILY